MRVLLDTCVVLDAMQNREPFCKDAQKIFLLAANRNIDGYLSASAATDIYYLMHRHTHSNAESRKVMNTLFSLFDLLDTTGMDCRHALSSPMEDLEDAVLESAAVRSEMDCIVARNLKDYGKARIRVYSPAEFLEKMAEKEAQISNCGP